MAAKQIKTIIQNSINNYIFSACNLCMILANDNFRPWFYENYIQLYFIPDKNGRYEENEKWLDFYGALTAPQEILEYEKLKKESFYGLDIIKFIEGTIDSGYCFFSYYDEYYVKANYRNANRHFAHDILIYGYDRDKELIMAIGYNDNTVFTRYEINYKDFKIAFEKALEQTNGRGWDDMEFYGLNIKNRFDENYEYNFDISKFMSGLYDYIHSVNTGKTEYPVEDGTKGLNYLYTIKSAVYGIDVIDHIIEYVKSGIGRKSPLSYVVFHTLHEHKLSLIERLRYMAERFNIRDITELIAEYQKIVVSFNRIKLLTLKYNTTRRESLLKDMIMALEPEKERERAVLEKAYGIISDYVISEKNYLVISRNTGQMLLIEKTLRDAGIKIELVPAPPRQGMLCTRAVKINGVDLERVRLIFEQKKINVAEIAEDEGMKLKGLLEDKLADSLADNLAGG